MASSFRRKRVLGFQQLQLALGVVGLLLRSLSSDANLLQDPRVSVLNAFRDLGERSIGRTVGTILEVGGLLASFSP